MTHLTPNHPLTASAIRQFAYYADQIDALNIQQEKFHAVADKLIAEGDLYRLVRFVDNGIPQLSKDRKRGVLTVTAARWIRMWRFNVQRLILDQTSIQEIAA